MNADRGYEVVWNGCKRGPGGAYLFAHETPDQPRDVRSVPPPALSTPLSPVKQTVRTLVVRRLRRTNKTMRELVSATGLSFNQVQSAVADLRSAGLLRVVGAQPSVLGPGRPDESIYGLTDAVELGL